MFYDIEKSPKVKELIGEIQILIKVVSSNKKARGTLPVSFSIKMFDTQHETTICQESEWTVKAEIRTRKKFLAMGEACMAIFWSTPGFARENFCQLWVLNTGDLNFCVRSTPLQDGHTEIFLLFSFNDGRGMKKEVLMESKYRGKTKTKEENISFLWITNPTNTALLNCTDPVQRIIQLALSRRKGCMVVYHQQWQVMNARVTPSCGYESKSLTPPPTPL